jgi:hypothetical protein
MVLDGCMHIQLNALSVQRHIYLINPSVNPISISISFPFASLAFAMLKVDKIETMVAQTVASAA